MATWTWGEVRLVRLPISSTTPGSAFEALKRSFCAATFDLNSSGDSGICAHSSMRRKPCFNQKIQGKPNYSRLPVSHDSAVEL